MPWSGGTFSRANGATGWQDDAAANIGIEAGRHDTQDNDFRTGINATLTKDGTNSPTANLPMAGYRHTGAGNAVGDADYCTYGQAKAGVNIAVAGTVDYTVSQYSADANGGKIALQKARSSVVGTNTIVNSGDTIGSIVFRGANGSTFTDAASIQCAVDGTPGATNDMPGRLIFATTPDGSGGPPAERMRISAAGTVGIGVSNPQYNLDVVSDSAFAIAAQLRGRSSDNISVLRFAQNDGTTELARIQSNAGSGDLSIQRSGANNITLATDGLGRLTVRGNGNIWLSAAIATTATAANLFVDTGDNYNVKRSTSSIRYKTNVQNYTKGLNELNELRPVSFNGINDGAKLFAGFIAEEVEALGLTEFVQYDGDSQPDALSYANMTALIVKAVQELAEKVELLTTRLEALEGA